MPTLNINGNIRTNTAAGWAADATVYTAKTILVTTDATYGATDQRKFKIADGTQTWSNLDYFPVSGYDDASSSIQTQLNAKEPTITTLSIAKGGTNSGTALNNGRVMISSAGTIIEGDTATYPSTTELAYVKGVTSAIQTQLDSRGYSLQGSGNSITTVADSTNYYFADPNIGTTTSADTVQLTIPKTGILKKAVIYARVAGTLASNEQSTMYFRLNSATDVTLSSAITLTASAQTFTSGALSQAVTVGDTFAFKFSAANFGINPTTVSFTVSLIIEYA